MITAKNNAGRQVANDVGDILADFEISMLLDRKKVVTRAVKEQARGGQEFSLAVYSQMEQFDKRNRERALKAFNEATRRVKATYEELAEKATDKVAGAVKRLEKEGFVSLGEIGSLKIQSEVVFALLSQTMATLYLAVNGSAETVKRQTLQVATVRAEDSDSLIREVSRLGRENAKRGATVNQNGKNFEISGFGEMTVYNDSIDLYRQAQGEAQAEAGIALVQISAHPSSCPLCVPWQTKILVNDEFAKAGAYDGKYELLSTAIAEGLFHYNCRHEMTEFVEGVSDPNLYRYDKASEKETAMRYAVEQQQRANERAIREWRRAEAEAIDRNSALTAQNKVAEWQLKQRELAKIAEDKGLPFYRQYHREQIGGATVPKDVYTQVGSYWLTR